MNPKSTKEEVLLAFSVEDDDTSILGKYIQNYPEFKTELIELSLQLMLSPLQEDPINEHSAEIVEQAWGQFQSVTNDLPGEAEKTFKNPFEEIEVTQFRELSKDLDITTLLFMRFRDRGIELSTIPKQFLELLTKTLEVDSRTLTSYLQRPHIISPNQNFKSDNKPEASDKISFQEAIELSHLSASQKNKLKNLLD